MGLHAPGQVIITLICLQWMLIYSNCLATYIYYHSDTVVLEQRVSNCEMWDFQLYILPILLHVHCSLRMSNQPQTVRNWPASSLDKYSYRLHTYVVNSGSIVGTAHMHTILLLCNYSQRLTTNAIHWVLCSTCNWCLFISPATILTEWWALLIVKVSVTWLTVESHHIFIR